MHRKEERSPEITFSSIEEAAIKEVWEDPSDILQATPLLGIPKEILERGRMKQVREKYKDAALRNKYRKKGLEEETEVEPPRQETPTSIPQTKLETPPKVEPTERKPESIPPPKTTDSPFKVTPNPVVAQGTPNNSQTQSQPLNNPSPNSVQPSAQATKPVEATPIESPQNAPIANTPVTESPPVEQQTAPETTESEQSSKQPIETPTPTTQAPQDRSAILHKLSNASVVDVEDYVDRDERHANSVKFLVFDDDSKGVFKSGQGERGEYSSLDTGTFYKREVASSDIAHILGASHLLPTTSLRNWDDAEGSVQDFVEGEKARNLGEEEKWGTNDEDLQWAGVLDYLLCNLDRHSGNWMVKDGRISLIDNGTSLPKYYEEGDFLDSALLGQAVQRDLPIPDLTEASRKWPEIEEALRKSGIEDTAIRLTKKRFNDLIQHSGIEFGELPGLFAPRRNLRFMWSQLNPWR